VLALLVIVAPEKFGIHFDGSKNQTSVVKVEPKAKFLDYLIEGIEKNLR